MKSRICRLVLFMATIYCSPDFAAQWRSQPDFSRLQFESSYEGQRVPGVFRNFEVKFKFDPARVQQSELEVKVSLASADMDSADVNEAIASPEWFDVIRFPESRFFSRQITADGGQNFTARGSLQLKGIRREITVPFQWYENGDTARMHGEFVLARTDFDVGGGEWASGNPIGLDVKVKFSLSMRRLP